MDRHRGRMAGVTDAVDVVGLDAEAPAGADLATLRSAFGIESVFAHRALDDRHRAARAAVVVEPGVVTGRPAQQPHRDAVVFVQQVKRAAVGVVSDVALPRHPLGSDVPSERVEPVNFEHRAPFRIRGKDRARSILHQIDGLYAVRI